MELTRAQVNKYLEGIDQKPHGREFIEYLYSVMNDNAVMKAERAILKQENEQLKRENARLHNLCSLANEMNKELHARNMEMKKHFGLKD